MVLVLVLVLVGWQRQCVAEWRSERVSEWRSELERTLPREVARTLSRWSTSLTRSLTHATAVARESFVVEQVQRGLWPPEVSSHHYSTRSHDLSCVCVCVCVCACVCVCGNRLMMLTKQWRRRVEM